MTTTATMDEVNTTETQQLHLELSAIRQQKGYSIEYVASKL
ncbi:MAG: helix-turn-helix domain-containing protein, partial [Legionella sp.]